MIVIQNCRSGPTQRQQSSSAELEEAFRRHGLEAEFWCTTPKKNIRVLAAQALETDDETIVAAGGDGTISTVGGALVDRPKRLGVLPLGTLNHFAKDLGVPLALDDAIAALVNPVEQRVDVAEVNGRIFLNNSSLGLYPRIVRHRAEQQERLRRGKWPAFAWAVLSAVRVCPAYRLQVRADGAEVSTRTPFFFVGNNAYTMDGLRVGKRDQLDAGALHAYFAHNPGRLGLMALAARSLVGRLSQAKSFEALPAREILVDSRHRKMDVALDGEVCHLETPLHYRIRPRALRVIGPPAAN